MAIANEQPSSRRKVCPFWRRADGKCGHLLRLTWMLCIQCTPPFTPPSSGMPGATSGVGIAHSLTFPSRRVPGSRKALARCAIGPVPQNLRVAGARYNLRLYQSPTLVVLSSKLRIMILAAHFHRHYATIACAGGLVYTSGLKELGAVELRVVRLLHIEALALAHSPTVGV